MDSNNILDKMNSMKLEGMYTLYKSMIESNRYDFLNNGELVTLLINGEWDNKENKRIERTVKQAKFRYQAAIENIKYNDDRGLDKSLLIRLSDCSYITQAKNILITGLTGTGKSYLASAFGHQACFSGFKVVYYNAQKLFAKLKSAKADGTYYKMMSKENKSILDKAILSGEGNLWQRIIASSDKRLKCSSKTTYVLFRLSAIFKTF